MDKKPAFEYYVIKLHEWYQEVFPGSCANDLSILKVLKLLFFGTAVTSNEEDSLLDGTFNNFWAMPFGHVESDIYDLIKKGEKFKYFSLSNNGVIILQEYVEYPFKRESYKDKIDDAIVLLKAKNPDLIKMSSANLVNLSHEWYSWRFYFDKARKNGVFSAPIPPEIIKKEQQYFSF